MSGATLALLGPPPADTRNRRLLLAAVAASVVASSAIALLAKSAAAPVFILALFAFSVLLGVSAAALRRGFAAECVYRAARSYLDRRPGGSVWVAAMPFYGSAALVDMGLRRIVINGESFRLSELTDISWFSDGYSHRVVLSLRGKIQTRSLFYGDWRAALEAAERLRRTALIAPA